MKPAAKTAPAPSGPKSQSPASQSALQFIPAISDADGPEPRPYKYDLSGGDEQTVRAGLLALAAKELDAYRKQLAANTTSAAEKPRPRTATTSSKKSSLPDFQQVELHSFDLSNSNQPVFVLSAALLGAAEGTPTTYITLVARQDIYGDLHKALSQVTDSRHLDLIPRLELMDAVDVDGDTRGELLFRQISDVASGYVVYRITGDQSWKLYDSFGG